MVDSAEEIGLASIIEFCTEIHCLGKQIKINAASKIFPKVDLNVGNGNAGN